MGDIRNSPTCTKKDVVSKKTRKDPGLHFRLLLSERQPTTIKSKSIK